MCPITEKITQCINTEHNTVVRRKSVCHLQLSHNYVFCCQSLRHHVQLCDPMYCSKPGFLSFTISPSSLKFISLIQRYYLTISSSATLFSFCLQSFPAIFACNLWVFSNELFLHMRYTYIPKYMLSLIYSKHSSV